MKSTLLVVAAVGWVAVATAHAQQNAATVPTPTDVKPGSITCEDVPYPYATTYLPLTLYGQDVRIAYMDVPPLGAPNGSFGTAAFGTITTAGDPRVVQLGIKYLF